MTAGTEESGVLPLADAHIHLFDRRHTWTAGGGPVRLADELASYEELRAEHAIGRALVVGYEGDAGFGGNNDHIATLAATRPWMAPVAYRAPDEPPTIDEVAEMRERGFCGISLYAQTNHDAAAAVAAWPRAAVEALASWSAVVSINAPAAVVAELARS